MIKFYTSRLLDLVEKATIDNQEWTSFFTEIGLGVPRGTRLFIVNGNYDSNELLKQDRFVSGGDGYRVLQIDNNRVTLSIPWTGRGINSDASTGSPINIWVVNTVTEFNYLKDILVDIYPERCSKFQKGLTKNIIYTQNLVFSGQFFIRAFWAKNDQGGWDVISNFFDDGFDDYFSDQFDISSWNGKIKIRNSSFVYKTTEFVKNATYIWSNPRWVYDTTNTPCFISKLNFRQGVFNGDFYDGVYGQLDTKLTFTSNWFSGVAFNSEIKSSSVRTKSQVGETITKAFKEANKINFFSDKSNNDGYGLSYFFDSTIESGDIFTGNFINCNFSCDLNPEVTDVLQITTIGCLQYGTCCDTTTSTTTTTTSTTTTCECYPCVEGERGLDLEVWINEGSLKLDYRLSTRQIFFIPLSISIFHRWYLMNDTSFVVNAQFNLPEGAGTSDFSFDVDDDDLIRSLTGQETIDSYNVSDTSHQYKINVRSIYRKPRPSTTSTTTTTTTSTTTLVTTTTTTSTTTRVPTTSTTTLLTTTSTSTTTSTTTLPTTSTSTTSTSTTSTTTSTTTLPTTTTSTTTILVPTTGFRSVWNITSPGQTITLPLIPSGIYNFDINWGDGNSQTLATYSSRTHTYSSVGTYSISITGQIEGWSFRDVPSSRDNILSVLSWESLKIGNQGGAFYFCQNLTLDSVTDTLDLSGVTNLSNTFERCISLSTIENINSWDVSSVTNMSGMFMDCSLFNQPLNDWDVSNVTNMSGMFSVCNSFNQPLNNWDVSNVTDMKSMFIGCQSFNQPLNDWNVSNVTNMSEMFWDCLSFNQPLNDWNVSNVTNMSSMFRNTILPIQSFDQPLNDWDVSNVTDMSGMFKNCLSFNHPLNNWNVSNVTNMSEMFWDCTSFDQLLNDWDVSSVSDMQGMFFGCVSFDQPLNDWDVSNVTNMSGMFSVCNSFNQPLDNWNVSNVTNMSGMFSSCQSFDQPLNDWYVSNVTDMYGMFAGCISFNQPLNDWDVSNVTNMSAIFGGCTSFNQSLNDWDVSNVTNMSEIFGGCTSFNQSLNDWVVSSVTNMSGMFFNCQSFNQPLNNWDVSSVISMENMFRNCQSFNQPLNNWDVCNVTNMSEMFRSCSNYDQDISSWKVPLILTKPFGFDTNTPGTWTTQEKPQWGVSC